MIRFACPACGKVYKAGLELAGRKSICKTCSAVVVIPERPVQEILYGVALPPEGTVEPTPEPEPEPEPQPPKSKRKKKRPRLEEVEEDYDDRPSGDGKYCHECGRRIRSSAETCPKCGASQAVTEPVQDERRDQQQPSREQLTAGILAILLGGLGVHKFYLGNTAAGLVMLLVSVVTFPCYFGGLIVMSVIGVVEGVMYLTKSRREFHRDYVIRRQAWF